MSTAKSAHLAVFDLSQHRGAIAALGLLSVTGFVATLAAAVEGGIAERTLWAGTLTSLCTYNLSLWLGSIGERQERARMHGPR